MSPALCQCIRCFKYLARDRQPQGPQLCVECDPGCDDVMNMPFGIPLADLRGPITDDPLSIELLGLLAEECGEVSQRIGKILRWGWAADHGGTTQQHKFEIEIADVLVVAMLLISNGLVDRTGILSKMRDKLGKLHEDAQGPRQRLTVATIPPDMFLTIGFGAVDAVNIAQTLVDLFKLDD